MANGHGGARTGSGRPKGGGARRNSAFVIRTILADPRGSPAAVLFELMHAHKAAGNMGAAQSCARDLAPYVHPKLASIDVNAAEMREPEQVTEIRRVIVRPRDRDLDQEPREKPLLQLPGVDE